MNLTIIGAGKLMRALASGWLSKQVIDAERVTGVARSDASRNFFQAIHPKLKWSTDPLAACAEADVIILAVKPFQFSEVIPPLAKFADRALFLSVAAGITLDKLTGWLGSQARVVRTMPNTPVLVGAGVTAYTPNNHVTAVDITFVEKLFNAVGRCYRIEENLMATITALSGSGPAYFYQFVDILAQQAVANGLSKAQALEMALQTALGAALMLQQTKQEPQALIEQVRSKGGTTEAALNAFAAHGLDACLRAGFEAARTRSDELAKG